MLLLLIFLSMLKYKYIMATRVNLQSFYWSRRGRGRMVLDLQRDLLVEEIEVPGENHRPVASH
jgi:hypothetical protein